jgi:hypothetical protein
MNTLLFVHGSLFLLLVTNQFSSWQTLSANFYKELALEQLIRIGEIKIMPYKSCQPIDPSYCNGIWSCSELICELEREYNYTAHIITHFPSTGVACNNTNYDTINNKNIYYANIKIIFHLIPIASAICLIFLALQCIFVYCQKISILYPIGYITLFFFVISKVLLFSQIILVHIYNIDYKDRRGDGPPEIIEKKIMISQSLLGAQVLLELLLGSIEMHIFTGYVYENIRDAWKKANCLFTND